MQFDDLLNRQIVGIGYRVNVRPELPAVTDGKLNGAGWG